MTRALTVLLCLSFALAAAPSGASSRPAKAAPKAAPPDTMEMLQKAVAKDSTRFDDLYQLGILSMDRDRVDDAVKLFMKAHLLRPQDYKVLVNLGAAEDASGRSVWAQTYYREALKIAPGDSVASCRLASSLYAQNQYGEAMDLLRQVIKNQPTAYCAYFTMGVAFADAGIYRDAIRMWKKVVELAPTSPEAVSARESMDVLEKIVEQ